MPIALFTDPQLRERLFAERYRCPPIWFELVSVSELEDLARKVGRRIGSTSTNIVSVCRAASAMMPLDQAGFERWYDPSIHDHEPLKDAVRRLNVPTDSAAYLVTRSDEDSSIVQVRMRDLVTFEDIIWWTDMLVIQERGDWILEGTHMHLARWLDFRR